MKDSNYTDTNVSSIDATDSNENTNRLYRIVESKLFNNSIILLILINAVTLGMQTSANMMNQYGNILELLDNIILTIFTIEITLRIIVHRVNFFTNPWSLFDFCVVAISFVPANDMFATLRTLRVLRILRLVTAVSSMRKVVQGLLEAIPGILSVCAVLLLIFYVFSVIGTHLYSATFPNWFGDLGRSMFTLFQIMTLEGWAMEIVRPVMMVHPYSWMFFVSYILATTFIMLNLFIAIIVNSMHETADANAEKHRQKHRQELSNALRNEIMSLENKIEKLTEELNKDKDKTS